jgi:hypothetical protein
MGVAGSVRVERGCQLPSLGPLALQRRYRRPAGPRRVYSRGRANCFGGCVSGPGGGGRRKWGKLLRRLRGWGGKALWLDEAVGSGAVRTARAVMAGAGGLEEQRGPSTPCEPLVNQECDGEGQDTIRS